MKTWVEIKMMDNSEMNEISIHPAEDMEDCNIMITERDGDFHVSMYFDKEKLKLFISNLEYFYGML